MTDNIELEVDEQKAAIRAGMLAIGNHHLKSIYDAKALALINQKIAPTANAVYQIISAAERIEPWTAEEIQAIWDRVETEL